MWVDPVTMQHASCPDAAGLARIPPAIIESGRCLPKLARNTRNLTRIANRILEPSCTNAWPGGTMQSARNWKTLIGCEYLSAGQQYASVLHARV